MLFRRKYLNYIYFFLKKKNSHSDERPLDITHYLKVELSNVVTTDSVLKIAIYSQLKTTNSIGLSRTLGIVLEILHLGNP